MKKLSAFLIVIILCATFLIPMQSIALKKLGQVGLKFLDVCVGARPAAMGEAFSVVSDDATAIFHNPAGIAQIEAEKFELTFCKTLWIADISYNAAGLIVNGGIWGNFGVSIISPDYGDFVGTRVAETEQGFEETGMLDVGAFSLGFAYGRKLTDKFMFGGHVKWVSQHLGSNLFALERGSDSTWIEDNKVSTIGYDVGTIFYPGFKSFRFGMFIRNFSGAVRFGEKAEYEEFQLPLTFKIGVAMDILDLFGEHPDNSFVIDIDAVHPRDYTERLQIGGEFVYKDMIALRGGYKFNYDEEGLTLGVGIRAGGIKLDYAYCEFGTFNFVNRVSLGVLF